MIVWELVDSVTDAKGENTGREPMSAREISAALGDFTSSDAMEVEEEPLQMNSVDNTVTNGYNNVQNGGTENGTEASGPTYTGESTQGIRDDVGRGEGFLADVDSRGKGTNVRGSIPQIVRVSSEANKAYQSRGIVNYEMHDSTHDSTAFSNVLNEAREADTEEKAKTADNHVVGVATLGSVLRAGNNDISVRLTVKFFDDSSPTLHVIINGNPNVKEAATQQTAPHATKGAPDTITLSDYFSLVNSNEFTKRMPESITGSTAQSNSTDEAQNMSNPDASDGLGAADAGFSTPTRGEMVNREKTRCV